MAIGGLLRERATRGASPCALFLLLTRRPAGPVLGLSLTNTDIVVVISAAVAPLA